MRLGGIILYALFFPLLVVGFSVLPILILWNPVRAKEAMRAVDQFCNAFWLNGSGRESVSSHSWRERGQWWARFVIGLTDLLERGHCEQANKFEQPVKDFIDTH